MNQLIFKSVFRNNNKLCSSQFFIHSNANRLKFTFSTKFTKDPNFLDSTKFIKDEGLLLYESKDKKFFMFISCSLFAYTAYHGYNWYFGDDQESAHNSFYLSVVLGAAFIFYQYKLVKTPERIWLDINGKDAYIDFFNYFAFGNNFTLMENKLFCGHGFFIHKYTKMPVAYYNLNGKKKSFFIKYSNIIEDDILRKLLKGQEFNINTQDLNVKLSKKTKSHYKI